MIQFISQTLLERKYLDCTEAYQQLHHKSIPCLLQAMFASVFDSYER